MSNWKSIRFFRNKIQHINNYNLLVQVQEDKIGLPSRHVNNNQYETT